jgi:hypothetical protein
MSLKARFPSLESMSYEKPIRNRKKRDLHKREGSDKTARKRSAEADFVRFRRYDKM